MNFGRIHPDFLKRPYLIPNIICYVNQLHNIPTSRFGALCTLQYVHCTGFRQLSLIVRNYHTTISHIPDFFYKFVAEFLKIWFVLIGMTFARRTLIHEPSQGYHCESRGSPVSKAQNFVLQHAQTQHSPYINNPSCFPCINRSS